MYGTQNNIKSNVLYINIIFLPSLYNNNNNDN